MKTPEWATHYMEMMDGSKFFVEMCDEKVIQFDRVDGECYLTPMHKFKASLITIDEYKAQMNHKYPKLGEL